MKKLRGMWKRIAAMTLAAMLLAGSVPETAFAAGIETQTELTQEEESQSAQPADAQEAQTQSTQQTDAGGSAENFESTAKENAAAGDAAESNAEAGNAPGAESSSSGSDADAADGKNGSGSSGSNADPDAVLSGDSADGEEDFDTEIVSEAVAEEDTEDGDTPLSSNDTASFRRGAAGNGGDKAAKIGDTEYETLETAINEADNSTIVLLNDVNINAALEIPSGRTVTLDLNDHYILYNGNEYSSVIKVKGSLTLKDSKTTNQTTRYVKLENGRGTELLEENATLELEEGKDYVKVEGGFIAGGTAANGGGVYVTGDGASFAMAGGTITGCVATGNGGGVYVTGDGASFAMNGGTITGCSAYNGGGVYVQKGDSTNEHNCKFTMQGGSIEACSANSGGGVYVQNGGAFTMADNNDEQGTDGTIEACSATASGGGVYVASGGTFSMAGGEISVNKAGNDGGGVSIDGGAFSMAGGKISGNDASAGGGVYVGNNVDSSGTFTMTDGIITGNNVSGSGGGVLVCINSYQSNSIHKIATFNVSGKPVIRDNWCEGILSSDATYYVKDDENNSCEAENVRLSGADATNKALITVTAPLNENAKICVSIQEGYAFAVKDGYGTFDPSDSDDKLTMAAFCSDDEDLVVALGTYEDSNHDKYPALQLVTVWAALQAEFDNASTNENEPTVIKLERDCVSAADDQGLTITIPDGKHVTLDLNNHYILYKGDANASVISVNSGNSGSSGALTLTDSTDPAGDSTAPDERTPRYVTLTSSRGTAVLDSQPNTGTAGTDYLTVTGGFLAGDTGTMLYGQYSGGGVYLGGGSLTISGGSILGCIAQNGGGVCLEYGNFSMEGGTITNCAAYRTASQGGYGGAVYAYGDCCTMEGGTIKDCTAQARGGALYVDYYCTFTMKGGTIKDCTAQEYGGAVYTIKSCTMEDGTIKDCTAQEYGGAVYAEDTCTFTMRGGTINRCKASVDGGAVYIRKSDGKSGVFEMQARAKISGCSASGNGGGVYTAGEFSMNKGSISGASYGEITGCTAANGGGVYVAGKFGMSFGRIHGNNASGESGAGGVYAAEGSDFSVSDTPRIDSNFNGGTKDASGEYTAGQSGKAGNVGLADGVYITIDGDLSSTGILYVSGEKDRVIAVKRDGDEFVDPTADIAAFVSDDEEFVVGTGTLIGSDQVTHPALQLLHGRESLQEKFDSASKDQNAPTTITLDCDYIFGTDGQNLTVPKEKAVTLDLNGHYILLKGSNKSVFQVKGILTLTDSAAEDKKTTRYVKLDNTGRGTEVSSSQPSGTEGTDYLEISGGFITGGSAENGGGVCIIEGGKFNLDGGTICGCTAVNSGGGVYDGQGTFTIKGGEIYRCTAASGGGAGVEGNGNGFHMYGGTIRGCVSTNTDETKPGGGGVCISGSSDRFVMQASPDKSAVITGCASGTYGGGVFVGSGNSFTMCTEKLYGKRGSAVITGCNSEKGGGVYVQQGCSFEVQESPVIKDNFKGGTKNDTTGRYEAGTSGKASNIMLAKDVYITIIGGLSGSNLNVSGAKDQVIAVKKDWNNNIVDPASDLGAFVSDDENLGIAAGTNDGSSVLKFVSAWSLLREKLSDTDTSLINLTHDYTAFPDDEALTIPAGKTVVLDLNGYTIDRGLSEKEDAAENGNVITVNGSLTLKDSGGIMDDQTGQHIGGAITGGNNSGNGGGVYVAAGGELIVDNQIRIMNNNAANGGGVFVDNGVFTMSGAPVIKDNSANNVALNDGTIITVTGALEPDAEIHINADKGITVAQIGGTRTASLTETEAGYFKSDVSSDLLGGLNDAGQVVFKEPLPALTSPADLTYNGTEQEPELIFEGVSLTAGTDYTVSYERVVGDKETALSGAPKDAGSYKAVAAGKGSYAGTSEASFTIAPKPVTVGGIKAKNKAYDTTTTAELDCSGATFAGKVDGDNLTVSGTGTFDNENAGKDKTVTISGLTLGGESAGNYALTVFGNQGTTTATITRATPEVTAPTASATYMENLSNVGLNNPTGNLPGTWTWATDNGINPNETAVGTVGTHVFRAKFTPTDTANYCETTMDVTVTVGKAMPHLTIDNFSAPYGHPVSMKITCDSDGEVTYVFYKNDGKTKTNTEDGAETEGGAPRNAGTYDIKASVAETSNYLSNEQTLDDGCVITQAPNPAVLRSPVTVKRGSDYDLSGLVSDAKGTVSFTLNGSPAGYSLSGRTLTLDSNADSSCTITVTADGTVDGKSNYETFSGELTVNATDLLPQDSFGFADVAQEKTYGDGDFIVVATGAETGSNVTYSSSDPQVATVEEETGKVTIKKAGTATITATAGETATYASATASYKLTVNRRPVTISGIMAVDMEYNAATAQQGMTLNTTSAKIGGKVDGDVLTVEEAIGMCEEADAGKNKTVTISRITLGGSSAGNYTVDEENSQQTTTINITKADIPDTAITAPTGKNGLVYTGLAQSLVVAGTALYGEMRYALGTDTTAPEDKLYSASIPAAMNAGTYYVWYMVKGDRNHNDSSSNGPVTVTIGRASGKTVNADAVEVQKGNNIAASVNIRGYVGTGAEITGTSVTPESDSGISITDISVSNDKNNLTFKVSSENGGNAIITVTLKSDNYNSVNLTIPVKVQDRVTEVKLEAPGTGVESSVQSVTVDGLDEYTDSQSGESVKVVLDVKPVSEPQGSTVKTKIDNSVKVIFNGVEEEDLKTEYLDISITKQVGTGTPASVGDAGRVLELALRYELSGKFNPVVIREHERTVTAFTALNAKPNENYQDGTFYIDEDQGIIYIYSRYFSNYSIAYATVNSHTVSFNAQEGSSVDPIIVADGGKISNPPTSTRSGYTLDGWFTYASGGEKLTTDTVITADITYCAQWTKNTSGGGGGGGGTGGGGVRRFFVTVVNGSGGGSYAAGTSVTITASAPAEGKRFKEWSGTDSLTFTSGSKTTASATFTMPAQAVSVTATYEDIPAETYTVSVSGGTGAGEYAEGESVTITANAPEEGKRFKEWTGADSLTFTSGSRTTEAATFTMPAQAVSLTATYEDISAETYTVSVSGGTGGGEYTEGDNVTITANPPEEGKRFKEWTGADSLTFTSGSKTTETATFTMPAQAVSVTATYEDIPAGTYTVTVTNDGHGTGTASPNFGPAGTKVTLTAAPAEGYHFKEWLVVSGGVSIANNSFVIGEENIVVKAVFEADAPHDHKYKDTITKEPTCTEPGVRTYTCSCGESYTEEISALGHHYKEEITKEPTTTEEGVRTFTCTRCGDSYTESIPMLNGDLRLYEKAGRDLTPRTAKKLKVNSSFTLVPQFADGKVVNERVVWASENPDVAAVTQDGKVTARIGGKTVVTVRSEENPELTAYCEVFVSEPVTGIELDKKSYTFGTGESVTLTAAVLPFTAEQSLIWSTSNAELAVVCDENGQEFSGTMNGKQKIYEVSVLRSVTVKALKAGSARVTAQAADGSGKKASCSFTIGNPVPDFTISGKNGATVLAAGKTLAMSVDWGSTKPKNAGLTWEVDKPSVATISDKGVLTGVSEGTVTVTATSTANPDKKATATITVYVPVKSVALNTTSGVVSKANGANGLQLSVNVLSTITGQEPTGVTLGTAPTVDYSVEPQYAKNLTVDKDGLIIAGSKTGRNIPVKVTVKAYDGYMKTLTCRVTVLETSPLKGIKLNKSRLSIGEGNTAALTASLNPLNPDGPAGITWVSSNPDVVKVDQYGNLTALKTGTATITATAKGTVLKQGKETHPSATCKVTVTSSVTGISFTNVSTLESNGLATGKSFAIKTEFVVSGEGRAASTELSWTSSDDSIAEVNSRGVVKAKQAGKVMITAVSKDTKEGNAKAPSASVTFAVHKAVTKVQLDKTKLTIGTQEGSQYGLVSIAKILPADATNPAIEWTANNQKVSLAAVYAGASPSTGSFAAAGTGVTTKSGEALAVKALEPGMVKLTGITTDGSNKKVTCTVTVRG